MSLGKIIDKKNISLSKKINKQKVPEHVAIIMDGNGRWATKKGLPRSFGHKQGVNVLKEIIKVSKNLGSNINQPSSVSYKSPIENKISENNQNIKNGIEITSPIIGTAYHAPEPGAKKFVEVGKKIKKGDTIMIVEAMKTMNHVPSTHDGVVKEICVDDGQPVEFGQTIIILA